MEIFTPLLTLGATFKERMCSLWASLWIILIFTNEWGKVLKNIADSEQSSHTPDHSYQRYGELILCKQIFLTIELMGKREKSHVAKHASPLSGIIQNLKILALIAGEKSLIFMKKNNGQIK